MRNRGKGNPFGSSGQIRDLQGLESAIRKKFTDYKTLLEKEGGSPIFTDFPSKRVKQMEAFIEKRIGEARAKNETGTILALEMYRVNVVMKAEEEKLDQQYTKNFYAWLMGHGTPEDHAKTPWGRKPHALELPDVRKVLEQILEALFATELYLVKLIHRTPQSLEEYAIYYKYILNFDHWAKEDDVWMFLDFPALVDGAIMIKDRGTGENRVEFTKVDLPPPQQNLHLPDPNAKKSAKDLMNKLGLSFFRTKNLKKQLYDLVKDEMEVGAAAEEEVPAAEIEELAELLKKEGNEEARAEILALQRERELARAAEREARLAAAEKQREEQAAQDRQRKAEAEAAKLKAKEEAAAEKARQKAEKQKAKEKASAEAAAQQSNLALQQTGLLQNLVQLAGERQNEPAQNAQLVEYLNIQSQAQQAFMQNLQQQTQAFMMQTLQTLQDLSYQQRFANVEETGQVPVEAPQQIIPPPTSPPAQPQAVEIPQQTQALMNVEPNQNWVPTVYTNPQTTEIDLPSNIPQSQPQPQPRPEPQAPPQPNAQQPQQEDFFGPKYGYSKKAPRVDIPGDAPQPEEKFVRSIPDLKPKMGKAELDDLLEAHRFATRPQKQEWWKKQREAIKNMSNEKMREKMTKRLRQFMRSHAGADPTTKKPKKAKAEKSETEPLPKRDQEPKRKEAPAAKKQPTSEQSENPPATSQTSPPPSAKSSELAVVPSKTQISAPQKQTTEQKPAIVTDKNANALVTFKKGKEKRREQLARLQNVERDAKTGQFRKKGASKQAPLALEAPD